MATDFFDRQDEARKRTGWLVAYFALAVVLIIAAVYAAVTAILVGSDAATPGHAPPIFDPVRFAGIGVVTGLVILLGSLFKILSLREGGAAVARSLGGRLVEGNSSDLAERRLLNIVEEMALASGTPVPPVYILDQEAGINAFAAGFAPGDAVIGVTRGTLLHLDRDQIQGVIAHEFSHILNGDMRLDLKLMGVLHGILLLALIGQILMRFTGDNGSSRSRRDDKKDNSAQAFFLVGLALYLIGYLGVFFGRLIKSAVSREREFLADASAIQFTRNPDGIGGALKKIGGLSLGSKVNAPAAEEACHLFIAAAVPSLTSLMATHPPLEERVKRIDPRFDGKFTPVRLDEDCQVADPAASPKADQPDRGMGGLGVALPGVNIPGNLGGIVLMPMSDAVESVGTPRPQHLAYASSLMAGLPDRVLQAAREPYDACCLIYALLLDERPRIRADQVARLTAHAAHGQAERTVELAEILSNVGPEARVPIVDLALPALHGLSRPQYQTFHNNIPTLIDADDVETLFEFTLRRMLFRHLDRKFLRIPPIEIQYRSLGPLLDGVSKLLGELAWIGHDDPTEVQSAFHAGLARLGVSESANGLPAREECTLSAVDRSLCEIAAATPLVKKQVLEACAAAISTDGQVTVAEGELLRAIADALDCPMPPLLGREQKIRSRR